MTKIGNEISLLGPMSQIDKVVLNSKISQYSVNTSICSGTAFGVSGCQRYVPIYLDIELRTFFVV